MNTLTYKGYTARIEFDERDNILVGRVLGVQDVVGFHAENGTELRAAFEEAVDDYVEACEKIGKAPQKSASGNLMLRINPDIHARVSVAAAAAGESINQWSEEVLGRAATEQLATHT